MGDHHDCTALVCQPAHQVHEGPILLDRTLAATRAWQVAAFPTTYVVGPDGHVEAGALGVRDWDHPEMAAMLARWMPSNRQ